MRTPLQQARGVILCLLLLYGVVGCAVERGRIYVKEGKSYGVIAGSWRDRWWNYYQRGTSYAEGEFWQDALADFQSAISQRDADQRQARTYGLHFIDYFPHRELGITYYHLRRYPEAIQELEVSLRSVETAKAKFYLNRARKALLEQSGRDVIPPRIRVDGPPDGLLTNRLTLEVTGSAEDDFYVSTVVIGGRPLFIELAEPRIVFAQAIPLQEGPNEIDIVARDLVGRQSQQRLTVHTDRQGPLLGLDRVELLDAPPQRRARLEGFVVDRSGIVRFALAGRAVPLRPQRESEFREEVPLPAGEASIPFEIEDAARNVTRGEIALPTTGGEPPGIRRGESPAHSLPRWASLRTSISDLGPFEFVPSRTAQRRDHPPPAIKLSGPAADRAVLYDDKIYLEIEVVGGTNLTSFSINSEPLLHRRSPRLFINYLAPLQTGANRFMLQAVDELGNRTEREIVVTREVEEVKRIDSRLRVALLPLLKPSDTAALAELVYDNLLTAFVHQQRFHLVEREHLEPILRELTLSQTELIDPRTRNMLGKVVAAEGALVGKVHETQRALDVLVRFADVETGVVLAAEDVYGEELLPKDVKTLMEGLAWKVRQRFPLVEGSIVEREGKTIFTDLTTAHRVQKYMKLIVFREGEMIRDPRDERQRRKPGKLMGEARIEAVATDLSEATLLQPDASGDVRKLDKVITK